MKELEGQPERDPEFSRLAAAASAERPLKGEDAVLIDFENALFGVFDGLGGHSHGDTASKAAGKGIQSYFNENAGSINRSNAVEHMKSSFMAAIESVKEEGYRIGSRNMATTATVLHVFEDEGQKYAAYGHVGDTRLYACLDEEKPVQITEDEGEGNALNNVIDAFADKDSLHQFNVFSVEPGDRFLIFSDGITGDWAGEEIWSYADMDFITRPDERIPEKDFIKASQVTSPKESADEFLRLSRKEDDKSAVVIDIK